MDAHKRAVLRTIYARVDITTACVRAVAKKGLTLRTAKPFRTACCRTATSITVMINMHIGFLCAVLIKSFACRCGQAFCPSARTRRRGRQLYVMSDNKMFFCARAHACSRGVIQIILIGRQYRNGRCAGQHAHIREFVYRRSGRRGFQFMGRVSCSDVCVCMVYQQKCHSARDAAVTRISSRHNICDDKANSRADYHLNRCTSSADLWNICMCDPLVDTQDLSRLCEYVCAYRCHAICD